MTRRDSVLLVFLSLNSFGCGIHSGNPGPGSEVTRPEQVLDFATLYGQNCAACHGADGRNGAALSLANPVYLAVAGEVNLRRIASEGVPGHLMPPFARSAGGLLTDQQIEVIVRGMIRQWGAGGAAGQEMPSYSGSRSGDPSRGEKAFRVYCASCHGAEGKGSGKEPHFTGSIVDPSYLALVSDQSLRSMIVAGQPGQGMPDFRPGPAGKSMTDEDITDTVAWLGTRRSPLVQPTLSAASPRE